LRPKREKSKKSGIFSMPELPEVQATVDYLNQRVKGRTILSCEVMWNRTLATHNSLEIRKFLVGSKIEKVLRRGKYIILDLSHKRDKLALLIHLRMSGSIEVISEKHERDPYDRFVLTLDNAKELRFNDVRKFGKIYLCPEANQILSKLGPEPLSSKFTVETMLSLFKGKKGAIKPLLLNQSFIAGIGNIYADESLWYAKIHPQSPAHCLSPKDISNLHFAIQKVLRKAIEMKGTDNGDEVVEGGMYQPKVYGRHNHSCTRCRSKIIRMVVGQRGTHYCSQCQKLKSFTVTAK
jgi:formamidopyrimidine-DNA glycosylase